MLNLEIMMLPNKYRYKNIWSIWEYPFFYWNFFKKILRQFAMTVCFKFRDKNINKYLSVETKITTSN